MQASIDKFMSEVALLLKDPKIFFGGLKKEQTLKEVLFFLLKVLFVGSLLRSLSDLLLQPIVSGVISQLLQLPYQRPTLSLQNAVYFIVLSVASMTLLVGPIYTFVTAIVLHIYAKIFKAQGSWKQTFKLYSYAVTPGYIFGWIPMLGNLSWIYVAYLLIVGSQKIHKFSKKKAMLVFGIPFILLLILTVIGVISTINTLRLSAA